MKLKDFAIFITIFLFIFISASPFKIRDDLEVTGNITSDSNVTADTFFGVFDGIDTMIDSVDYSDTAGYAKEYLNDSAFADTAGYALTYKNDSAYADTSGVALNADSLGHIVSTGYLNNTYDTTGTLRGARLIGDTVGTGLPSATTGRILMYATNLYGYNSTHNTMFLDVTTPRMLFKSSLGSSDTTLNLTYTGAAIQNATTNRRSGIVADGYGIGNWYADSLLVVLSEDGLNYYRYADQSIYATFGLNNLTIKDTTAGSGAYIFGVTKDSINMLTKKSWIYNNLMRMNYGIYVDSSSTFLNNLAVIGNILTNKITGDTLEASEIVRADSLVIEKHGRIDTIVSEVARLDTIVNLKTTGDHSTIDTAIIDTAKIRGLYVQQGAEVDSGLVINGTDVIGLYVNHGNSYFFDDVSIEYKAPYYQSYFGILDPRDSNAWLQTANDLRLYKQGITGSVFTDSLWLRIDSTGYKVIKYGTTDTTARLQNGYVYALDSIKTGAIKSKSGTDSTLITGGTIVLTDSVIGNGASILFTASAETLNWDASTGDGKVTGDFKVGDTLYINGNKIYNAGSTFNLTSDGVSTTGSALFGAYYPPSGDTLDFKYNYGTDRPISWGIRNADDAADWSIYQDSANIGASTDRINFMKYSHFAQPVLYDSLATFGKVTVNNMFKLAEGRFKDDTVFMLTDTLTAFTNGMQFIDTTGDDSLYTRVRSIWIKQ
ncbi:MAG: hypothetical protein PHE51_10355 [Eubacteriales bacterium]|nr:hypothetical protein [Eubacteriales bacterium]